MTARRLAMTDMEDGIVASPVWRWLRIVGLSLVAVFLVGVASGFVAAHVERGGGIDLFTIVVEEYDPAIAFFTEVLGFDLAEDTPSLTNDGRPKRWVVVRPPGAQTGILLARADGERQSAAVGRQTGGRVGFFLRVDDFDASHEHMRAAGVEFLSEPRTEPYGRVVVFRDIAGNRWDLLGPTAP